MTNQQLVYNRFKANQKYQQNILELDVVKNIIDQYMSDGNWIVPYHNGNELINAETNHLNDEVEADHHLFPVEYLELPRDNPRGVLWLPTKGPDETSAFLKACGIKATSVDTRSSYWSKEKKAIAKLSPDIIITVAYNSGGVGKKLGYQLYEVISVAFGKWVNDIIITFEIKKSISNEALSYIHSLHRKSHNDISFFRTWHMPTTYTHQVKPIRELIERIVAGRFTIDPFSGMSRIAHIKNDLRGFVKIKEGTIPTPANFNLDVIKFLNIWELGDDIRIVIFDPPFSERQIKEMYESKGLQRINGIQFADYWEDVKEMVMALEPDIIIFHGWNTNPLPDYEVKEVMMIAHGGWHNDTQITVASRSIPKTYIRPCRLPAEFMYERSDYRSLARLVIDDSIDLEIRKVSLDTLDLDLEKYQILLTELSHGDAMWEVMQDKIGSLA